MQGVWGTRCLDSDKFSTLVISICFRYGYCFYGFVEDHINSLELNLLEIDEIVLKGKIELNFI